MLIFGFSIKAIQKKISIERGKEMFAAIKKISRIMGFLAMSICLLSIASAAHANSSDMELFVGEVKTMSMPGVKRIAVGDGKLIDVSVVGNGQVLILANKAGVTTIHFWTRQNEESDIKVTVLINDIGRVSQDVNAMLSGIKNVNSRIVGDKVVLEGDNVSDETQDKLKEIVKRFPQVVNFVGKVGWEKMIEMDVRIVEFKKTALEQLGIDWQTAGITGPSLATAGNLYSNSNYQPNAIPSTWTNNGQLPILPNRILPFQTSFGLITQITSMLNIMGSSGDAYTLAEPKLSCRSGGEAKFLAGGEIPIPINNGLMGTQVIFKEYGIKLNIKPVADNTGTIDAKILTEVSSIDPSTTVLGYPGFLTRHMETEFNMRNGETLVIAGLLSKDASKDVNKVAGLGDIPVLGALFRSNNFTTDKTELVVFITPKIITSATSESQKAVEHDKKQYEDFKGRINEQIIE